MAGVYIHIPFCKKKCDYCNFFSVTTLKNSDALNDAICLEIAARNSYLAGETVNTIYFGGGTPSLLTIWQVENILKSVYDNFKIAGNAEITFEINPDDITASFMNQLIGLGVNRISIGVQSFFDIDLNYLGRSHTAGQAMTSLNLAKDSGMGNVSADLIFGIPTLTSESWVKNIEILQNINIQHISAYALTVEERTVLEYKLRKLKMPPPAEENYISQYKVLKDLTSQNGYMHYEISNFAKEGFLSRHNSAYWKGEAYIGIGPSAHSYNGISRQWNISRVDAYITTAKKGEFSFEKEELTLTQKYNEYVLTGLRTMWGCNVSIIEEKFGQNYASFFTESLKKHIENASIIRKDNTYILSNEGELLADAITADLFIDE